MIGAPCGSQMGNYLLYFKSSDTTNFTALSPVVVSLTNSVMGNISYLNPPTIPASGSTLIYFYISEANFDQLNLEFINDENYKNDPTAEITKVSIPAGTMTDTTANSSKPSTVFGIFKILNNQVLNAQVFKLSNPNACYTWTQQSLTLNISGSIGLFPKNMSISKSFKYFNYDSDATLQAKNSIKFTFTSAIVPSYFSCALVCFDSLFPSDNSIRNAIGVQSPLLKFFKTMITKLAAVDFIFDNLVRGLKYKLRCLIDSTEGEVMQRNTIGFVMDSYVKDDGTTVPIQTLKQIKPQCMQYVFTSEPSKVLKNAMMNFCQSIFMADGNWSANGCVVCTDSSISVLPSGFNLPKSLACADMNPKGNIINYNINSNSNYRQLLQLDNKNNSNIYNNLDLEDHNGYFKFLASKRDNKYNKFRSEERILQNNNTTDTNNKNNNSTIDPLPIISDKTYYIYSICPVPYQICPSDISGAKSYNDYFKTLINSFNSEDSISKNTNNTDFSSVFKLYKTLIVKDEEKPNLSKMSIEIISKNINGLVQWKSTFTTALNCYWQINDFATNMDGNSIFKCQDYSYCGNFRVTVVSSVSSTNLNFLQPLNNDYNYGLSIVCLNDIPYASLLSDVIKVKFVIDAQDANLNDNSGKGNDIQPDAQTNQNYVKFCYLVLLFCILFLV